MMLALIKIEPRGARGPDNSSTRRHWFNICYQQWLAEIVRDDGKKKELWQKELERWFEVGPESDDVVLIKVTPWKVAYWGDDEGEITLN